MLTPPSPTQITAHPTCLVAADTSILGPVTLGERVFVHPKASIHALRSPIDIGEGCLIEENVVIVNDSERTMKVGRDNVFQVGSRESASSLRRGRAPQLTPTGVEATEVGNGNTFQPRSTVSQGVIVSDNCVIGAGVHAYPLAPGTEEVLEPYTMVYGAAAERRVWGGASEAAETDLNAKHLDYIREILPKSVSCPCIGL